MKNHRYPKYILLSRAGVAYEFIGKIRKADKRPKILLYGHDVHFRRPGNGVSDYQTIPATREEKKGFRGDRARGCGRIAT